MTTTDVKVRIDKWLWAARFFKTRGLAKQAIEGGKVSVDGQRVKPSRDIAIGMVLRVRQGWDEKCIVVQAIAHQRRGASDAQLLYTETPESIVKRETLAEQRKLAGALRPTSEQRPNKKQRRQIHRFIQKDIPDN